MRAFHRNTSLPFYFYFTETNTTPGHVKHEMLLLLKNAVMFPLQSAFLSYLLRVFFPTRCDRTSDPLTVKSLNNCNYRNTELGA